jgi:hypothetical protein
MGEEETESPQTTWHREQEYQIDLFSLTLKNYEGDMRMTGSFIIPDKSNAYKFRDRWSDKEGGIEPYWVRLALIGDSTAGRKRGSSTRRVVMDLRSNEARESVVQGARRQEAGVTQSFAGVVGRSGFVFGLDHFGESAPAEALKSRFELTPEALAHRVTMALGVR